MKEITEFQHHKMMPRGPLVVLTAYMNIPQLARLRRWEKRLDTLTQKGTESKPIN